MNTDKHELDELKGERNYRGCLVRRIIGGFDLWGMKLSTGEEVDQAIDKASSIISESIPKDRGGVTVKDGFSCVNDFGAEILGNVSGGGRFPSETKETS